MFTLSGIQHSLQNYFPEIAANNFGWAVNPFGIIETHNLSAEAKEQLIDLRNNLIFQASLSQKKLEKVLATGLQILFNDWYQSKQNNAIISIVLALRISIFCFDRN